MTEDRKIRDDAALEALFEEAQAHPPEGLPEAFQARLNADALAAMSPAASSFPRSPSVRRGWLAKGWLTRLGDALAEIGGAPGLAGVGAAGLAGVWIGFFGPGPTDDLVNRFWQGAASVSPAVSVWIETDPLAPLGLSADDDLLALISDDSL